MSKTFSETRQQKQSQTNLQTQMNEDHERNQRMKNDQINSFSVLGISGQTLTKNPTQLTSNNHQASKHQTNSLSNSNALQSLNSRSDSTVIQQLLQLQQRWIYKQSQIRQYVQSLKKTIEQKDLKIERMEIDNYKLVTKISKVEKQKEHMTTKLNEIYEVVETMENEKLKKVVKQVRIIDSDDKRTKQKKLMCQDKLVSQTYKPISPKKQTKQQRNLNISSQEVNSTYYNYQQKPKTSTPPKQSPPHHTSTTESNLEQRIMTNLVKMMEQNYYPHPHPHLHPHSPSRTESQISSDRVSEDQAFVKKDREVRPTTTTAHTSGPQMRCTMIKRNSSKFKNQRTPEKEEKCEISYLTIDEERQNQKEQKNRYKSAKTITFSNDEEPNYRLQEHQENQFHSQNRIHSHAKNSLNSTPYQSAQITPQGSVKAIQSQNQSEAQSYVETVKRNQNILQNIIKRQGNMKLERVHQQLISNERQNKSYKLQVDKKSSLNSEDDLFPHLIQESRTKDVRDVQKSNKNSNKNSNENNNNNSNNSTNNNNEQTYTRDGNRKKTRMNTKLTNLDYSMTSSFVSLSEIDGSQFRDNKLGGQLEYSDVVIAKGDQYEKENQNNRNYHESNLNISETRQHRNDHDHRSSKTPSKDSKTDSKAKQSISQNCQTQAKQNTLINNNQQSQTNSMKKLSMASSSGSRFYYPEHKELVTLGNLELQQCNIKKNAKIEEVKENRLKNTENKQNQRKVNQMNEAHYHNMQNTSNTTDSNLRKVSSKQSINNKTLNVQVQNHSRVNSQQSHPSNPQALRSQNLYSPKFQSNTLGFNYTPATKNNLMNDKVASNKFMNESVMNRNSEDDKSTYQQLKKSPKNFSNSNDNFYTGNHKRFDTFAQENTHIKKPSFDQGEFECHTVSGKSNKSAPLQSHDHHHQPKQPFRQYTKERIPETKSTSFKDHSNSFYLAKSASSDQPINNHSFKKLYKFTTESSQQPEYQQQRQQQQQQQRSRKSSTQMTPQLMVNFDKILFENSILKSYNTTLQTKVKKMTKTEKLMERFSEQNATVLNRIHKKSIS